MLLASGLALAPVLSAAQSQRATAPSGPTASPATPAPAAVSADAGEFIYRTRAGDTLIGLSARLLREPRRWHELQSRNRIAEPRRMPRGSQVRIPYDWMKITRQSARVLERVGAVTADGRALVAGAAVDAGTIVETGADGSVTLELVDGSVLVLKPSSRLRLERLQRIDGAGADEALLQLDRGKLETEVKPRSDMGRFETRTPAAVSAVRGTGFRASFAGASRSATTETLEGAVAYRHQLARDPLFRALVSDAVTPGPASEVADLAGGRYWLRVHAIDADGFTAPFGPGSRVEVPVPAWVWFLAPAILLFPAL